MKLAPFALFLGCTAIIGIVALQPEPLQLSHMAIPVMPHFILSAIPHMIAARFVGPRKPPRLATEQVLALIGASAGKHNVPPEFVRSIVAAESNFDSDALSPKGAIGLMQLMPETAKEYGANPGLPEQNVDAGTHYLRVLMNRYQRYGSNSLPRVIAAYNAGPGNVDKYRGVPPFKETRGYVGRVLGFFHRFGGTSRAFFLNTHVVMHR